MLQQDTKEMNFPGSEFLFSWHRKLSEYANKNKTQLKIILVFSVNLEFFWMTIIYINSH